MPRRNKRRARSSRIRRDDEDDEEEECRNTEVHIGCSSMDQNQVIIAKNCKRGETGWLFYFLF